MLQQGIQQHVCVTVAEPETYLINCLWLSTKKCLSRQKRELNRLKKNFVLIIKIQIKEKFLNYLFKF